MHEETHKLNTIINTNEAEVWLYQITQASFLISLKKKKNKKCPNQTLARAFPDFRIGWLTVESAQCVILNEDGMDDWSVCTFS